MGHAHPEPIAMVLSEPGLGDSSILDKQCK